VVNSKGEINVRIIQVGGEYNDFVVDEKWQNFGVVFDSTCDMFNL